MHQARLICHSATPCLSTQFIDARINFLATPAIEIEYSLSGEIDKLLIPTRSTSKHADNLWQHTCFEAFIAAADSESYFEFNFAPSGEWAIYRFDSYRNGMNAIDTQPPIITTTRNANNLVVNVTVNLKSFLDLKNRIELRLALAAAIEDNNGALSYWALAHPPGKPDFHHRDSFALTLNRPKNSP
jgi:hypothetical protein